MTPTYSISAPAFVRPGMATARAPRSAGTYAAPPPPPPRSASQHRDLALDALTDAFVAHREAGADGYGSDPADRTSFGLAVQLLCALPSTVPDPDVGVDPDGEASLEWHHSAGWTFGVSVGPTGVLSYSGLFGAEEVAGQARFSPGEIPAVVLRYVRRATRRDG